MLHSLTIVFRLLIAFSWLSVFQIQPDELSSRLNAAFSPPAFVQTITHPDTLQGVRSQNTLNAPVVNVWYGANQTFTRGTPQEYVNIVGNAGTANSLSYRLNNAGAFLPLEIGPDGRRLAQAGDFNIDIPVNQLQNGANSVLIRASNNSGITDVTVTVNYSTSAVWPLPYTINWSSVSSIQTAVQVVDGNWQKTANGIRTTQIAYDRVLAIGNTNWTNYEVLVPVTIHGIDGNYYGHPTSANPGLGVNMRWLGHTDDPASCGQPKCGWNPTGASAWYEWLSNTNGRIKLIAEPPAGTLVNNNIEFSIGGTYWLRVRADGANYSVKTWPQGQAEPSAWTLTKTTTSPNLRNGSFLLVAHHVDVTFGNVVVTLPGGPPAEPEISHSVFIPFIRN